MRTIKLPDLLVEVDNELHFTEAFMFANQQNLRSTEDICGIIMTIMAHGCNIGTYTMSQLVHAISYEYMKKITDWQLTDEALRVSLSWIVNAISKLTITKKWGEGKTSSSDSHIVSFREQVLQQEFNVKFGDFALKFYTFVADNYAPFLSKPIECNEGEGPHVLDGKLYNESDLALEEHYTDTAAAGVITFTSFAFMGSEFNPRIRGIKKHRIFKIDRDKNYGSLEALLKHKERLINMTSIVEQWDRMAHFYGSIASGHVSASLAMRKLVSFNSKNEFYRANLQLGRILKTESTLKNMIDPQRRKRRQRGLLKGEEIHQLARDINYGNRGKITARDLIAQRNCCNCLTLIMACVIYWQAKEISRILEEFEIPKEIDLSMLEHISPVGWENVILYGEYNINKELIRR
jgi:TnpA family transposase